MAHRILLNSGDDISEDELRTVFAALERGPIEQDALDVQHFDADDTIDTTPALVRIPNDNQQIPLFVDGIVGYELEPNSINQVWLEVDPSAATDHEAVGLAHNTTGVAPSNPHLLVAEVDTNQSGSDAVTLLNRGSAPILDGEDINPRTIGAETPLLSAAAESAEIESLTADTADIRSAAIESANAESVTGNVIGTPGGRTNDVWQLDTSINDFGEAVNEVDEQASPGDRIEVPPVYYDCDTTAEIATNNVALVGTGNVTGHRLYSGARPHVFKTTDTLMLRVTGNACSVKGIGFDSDMDDSTPAIDMLAARPEITECSVKSMGDHNIRLYQTQSNNLNNALIDRVTTNYADGDGVHINAASDVNTRNTNAIRVTLNESTGCQGWGINESTYALGNRYTIQNYTEPNDGICDGGIRITAPYSYGRLDYWEGTGDQSVGISFDTGVAVGEIVESGAEYGRFFEFNDSDPSNIAYQYVYPGQPTVFSPQGYGVNYSRGKTSNDLGDNSTLNTYSIGSDARTMNTHYQHDLVGTSAEGVLNIGSSLQGGGMFLVTGRAGGSYFADLLLGVYGNVSVVSSEERQSPSNRSYTLSSGVLSLTMSSGTYDVFARSLTSSLPS
ncbi:hypothetical protein [Halococcus sp. PRR34]|uniref:hypothetical protein n=1 Tax=Halococcus sp. PRR34 TaxID=3020830 RepID=UPI00235DE8B4|nr:hypothetical protein [Halococcus sp. PRR34]